MAASRIRYETTGALAYSTNVNCGRIVNSRVSELIQPEKPESTLTVVVEHAQVVRFVQIVKDGIEVTAIPFLRKIQRQLVRQESLDAFCLELLN